MLYEKKINSFPKVISELKALDIDAGIRSPGRFSSRKCFVFVTRSANGFTSVLCSVKRSGKEGFPDKRLLAKEFGTVEDLETFLSGVLLKPLAAWEY